MFNEYSPLKTDQLKHSLRMRLNEALLFQENIRTVRLECEDRIKSQEREKESLAVQVMQLKEESK
jgi:hypothetical protein